MKRTMHRVSEVAALALFAACMAHAQSIVGDWQGTLDTGQGELRLVLHITKAADGGLVATIDSIDQGANGIPVASVTLKGSKLSLGVDAVNGSYEGTVNADASEIDGTWTQGQPLPLNFKRAAAVTKTVPKPAKPSDLDGSWQGTLDTGQAKLRIVFHITNTEDGLTATMDSPDQSVNGVPVTSVIRNGSALTLEVRGVGGKFEGKIASDLKTIDGTWSQAGNSLPLALKR
jgi:hypothetical protein